MPGLRPAAAQPRPPAIFTIPEFVATAVGFKALDETGPDWPGSDEVYAVFSDLDPNHLDHQTATFGDVDSGETRTFAATDNCIAPEPRCDHGLPAIHFQLSMWESDGGFLHGDLPGAHEVLRIGAATFDDLIGRADVSLSAAQLLAALPTVGASAEYTIKPTGGAGSYQLTYRITRVQNGLRRPDIGPAVEVGISLEASAGGNGKVALTWSGTSATSVDVYRDGVKIMTVANNGMFGDHTTPGTHSYRVCNAATTTCSADVSVAVT